VLNPISTLTGGTVSGDRVQRVYTPQSVVDALLRLWPEGIVADPCSGPDSLVPAQLRLMPPYNGCVYDKRTRAVLREADEKKGITEISEPLMQPGWANWPERTYVNPEFDQLRHWIRQFLESWEVVLMTPVRPHRRWWRPLLRYSYTCFLDPLRFVGFSGTFPSALALCYRGPRLEQWKLATAQIGEVIP
jgi:hypothetical protein